ncbi:MAG: hypothetical protein JSV64_02860 [Candidatus Bathyarchaeota archaeon]|jgi:ubiquinone/menaquinone biosynthesis C-methylase UbiE|nr:MAG: hypothetical protein JSV64_02860 [Candidatus Bathyarchaeota archaeon]
MTKSFVHFWQLLEDEGEAKERAERVLRSIRKYSNKPKKILELGVGIGSVLAHFPESFDIYGLDIERGVHQDMQEENRERTILSIQHA